MRVSPQSRCRTRFLHALCAGAKAGAGGERPAQHPEDSGAAAGASASAAAAPSQLPEAATAAAAAAPPGDAHADDAAAHAAAEEEPLAWLPATTAAVALRLAAFDAALIYTPGVPPARDTLQARFVHDLCSPPGHVRPPHSNSHLFTPQPAGVSFPMHDMAGSGHEVCV